MAGKPYRSVSAGGNVFDSQKVQYSAGTQNLLKTMMNESKLTNFQQRTLQQSLKDGAALPTSCNPTSSQYESTVRNPQPTFGSSRRTASLSGMRTKEQIMAGGGYEREKFRSTGSQTRDREREKDKFVRKMAGIDPDQILKEEKRPTTLAEYEAQQKKIAEIQRQMKLEEQQSKKKDRFEELWDEINDRRDFLYNMEKLGQGKDYRHLIVTEISQKIREMEVLDLKRSRELECKLRMESLTLDSLKGGGDKS